MLRPVATVTTAELRNRRHPFAETQCTALGKDPNALIAAVGDCADGIYHYDGMRVQVSNRVIMQVGPAPLRDCGIAAATLGEAVLSEGANAVGKLSVIVRDGHVLHALCNK